MHILHILCCFLFFGFSAHARWERPEEASAKVNLDRYHYKVFQNGTFILRAERQTEILKESARLSHGLTRIHYGSRGNELELEEAYTLNGDEKFPVRDEHIETKPLASMGQGFDDKNQLTIGFPQVAPGSKVYYRYELRNKKPAIQDLFSTKFSLGHRLQDNLEIHLDSEAPLYYEIHDPEGVLEVTEKKSDTTNLLTIRLKKPYYRKVAEEQNSVIDSDSLVWVAVSTADSWKNFPSKTPEKYEEAMGSRLPSLFEEIRKKAEGAGSDVEKINIVTSHLAERIRYVGDWAPVEGAFHPRPLETVVSTGFGDCKDFTSSTGAILRTLGFETHAAWVWRGRNPVLSPLHKVPAVYFNHAILYASRNGHEYWIDPTNRTSFAQGLYPDIAGRPALLLKPGSFALRDIPEMQPHEGSLRLKMQLKAQPSGEISGQGSLKLMKRSALSAAGLGLYLSPSRLEYLVMDWIHDPKNLVSWKLPKLDLSSRIVKDFDTTFEFQERWRPIPTSAGMGYSFSRSPFVAAFQFSRESRVSDLVLGEPQSVEREFHMQGRPVFLRRSFRCAGDSPWVKFSREIRRKGKSVVLKENVMLKKPRVRASEIQSAEFEKLQKQINECMQPALLIFQ